MHSHPTLDLGVWGGGRQIDGQLAHQADNIIIIITNPRFRCRINMVACSSKLSCCIFGISYVVKSEFMIKFGL